MPVGTTVGTINERIRALNRRAIPGPPSNLMPLDLNRTVTEWRSARHRTASSIDPG
jgi:hypothetical protein